MDWTWHPRRLHRLHRLQRQHQPVLRHQVGSRSRPRSRSIARSRPGAASNAVRCARSPSPSAAPRHRRLRFRPASVARVSPTQSGKFVQHWGYPGAEISPTPSAGLNICRLLSLQNQAGVEIGELGHPSLAQPSTDAHNITINPSRLHNFSINCSQHSHTHGW